MAKITLTDRKVQSIKPAPKGKREQVMDSLVPGFGVRVTDTGVKTYIMQARYPGSANPARREIGSVGVLTLEEAREKARGWHKLIKQGIDPAVIEQRQREQAVKTTANTVAAAFEDYNTRKLSTLKAGADIERRFRNHILPLFGETPLAELSDLAVLSKLVHPKMTKAPSATRQLLDLFRTFMFWVVDQRVYGLTVSPLAALKVSKIIGKVKHRSRVLSDTELRALWMATERLPYPTGPLYRMLMLNPLRVREAAETRRSEWDMRAKKWTIPGERMKGKLPHEVPITKELAEIAALFPNRGSFLFSHNGGETPMTVRGGEKKQRIDATMFEALREIAIEEGESPKNVVMVPWTTHDIRRTVRSRLSGLKGVPHDAKEALLAHVKTGVEAVYDQHKYFDEKREALEVWAAELRRIVEPQPANVVRINRRKA